MVETKPTVLILTAFFLPGFKGGGPIQSIKNIIDHLGNEFNFKIITYDRDLGDKSAYQGIRSNDWNDVNGAKVFYISPDKLSVYSLYKILNNTSYNIVYINSFFSTYFAIVPLILRRLGLIEKKTTILAPRGEFSPGAISLKKNKKKAYINLSKLMNLYQNVIWQSTSDIESQNIIEQLGKQNIVYSPNLPAKYENVHNIHNNKLKGSIKIIFLSRISRKKNLDKAIKMLNGLKGNIEFNIFGPIEDKEYWNQCLEYIKCLPSNVNVKYLGPIENNKVRNIMSNHHLFFFPTRGENFGHVIVESLSSGCPVLISDQTPWRNLMEKGIGWDIPLDKEEKFQSIIQNCIDMDSLDFRIISEKAKLFAFNVINDKDTINLAKGMFNQYSNPHLM